MSFNKGFWILKSASDAICPDITLEFDIVGECVIGRTQLNNCSNSQYISNHHCSFKAVSEDTLNIKSLAKFDVIFVSGVLLKKDEDCVIKHNTKIVLCQKLFKYTLFHNDSLIKSPSTAEPEIGETQSQSSSSSTNKRNRTLEMDPPFGGLKKAKSIDPEAAATMVENDRRAKEGVCMSLADIESSVCMRSHSALTVTKSLCRTLLSSFHCDICLEVIASCRSCVPCGHSYCAPCIQGVINAAATGWNATAAKCPRCRTNVAQVIPNKTVDAAIADCLGNIREVSNTCKEMRMPATVSESQDISLWEERYEVNEAPTREVLIQQNAAAAAARAQEEEDEEDEDEDEQEYISCVNAEVEYARSGRATCIHCRSLIGNGEIRFGVFQQAEEYYQPTTKFIHLNCGSAFNSHRADRESKIRLSSLRGLAALSARDQTAVRTALRNYE